MPITPVTSSLLITPPIHPKQKHTHNEPHYRHPVDAEYLHALTHYIKNKAAPSPPVHPTTLNVHPKNTDNLHFLSHWIIDGRRGAHARWIIAMPVE